MCRCSITQPTDGLPYFAEDLARKARRNSTKEVNHPLASTPKDELQFLREITGRAPEVTEVAGKNLFLKVSSPASIEDSKPVNAKSEEEDTESTSSSSSSNFGERSNSPAVHDAFLPKSDEKAEAGLLLCEKSNVAASCSCDDSTSASRLRAWSESDNLLRREDMSETITSSIGRANDPLDTKNLGRALSKSKDQPLSLKVRANVKASCTAAVRRSFSHYLIEQNIPSSRSLSSSNLMSRSYRTLFGNDDEDEILPDDDFLDDWDA